MFKEAKKLMNSIGASFVVSGEVLDERPMSQKRNMLNLIAKRAELKGLILRPLSAKCLSPTVPERNGWIKRDMQPGSLKNQF